MAAQPQADALHCPKCGAVRAAGRATCTGCGIVFDKWFARQCGDVPAPRSAARPLRGGAKRDECGSGRTAKTLLAVFALASVSAGIAWHYLGPEPRGEDVIITFAHGDRCHLKDWKFRYLRRYNQNRAKGNMLIVGRTQSESTYDNALRVFNPIGDKLAVAREDLRSIELNVEPDRDNSYKNRVSTLTLTTSTGAHRFEPHETRKLSRVRVLVPDAAHYYPEHFDDDYMNWVNASVYLEGVPAPECGGNERFNLTSDEHPKPWTPVHFDFPA